MKKSLDIISKKLNDPNFCPLPYTRAKWFLDKLESIGLYYDDSTLPHYRMKSNDIIVTVSPYPNIVIIDKNERSFNRELLCLESIPENEVEFENFWNQLKPLI